MSSGGSIASMNTTLRNNKLLLRGRTKGFFRRELTYSEIRNYYKESEQPIKKGNIDKEYVLKVRKQLLADRRKELRIQIIVSILVAGIIGLVTWLIFSISFPSSQPKTTQQKLIDDSNIQRNHHEMIVIGLKNMKDEEYFFAVGNFENALQIKSNDLQTELLYLEALCLLCIDNEQFCEKADDFFIQISNKYPKNKEIEYLRGIYHKSGPILHGSSF